MRPVDAAAELPPEASYHEVTRTLNLRPPATVAGADLPGWVRERVEALATRAVDASG